MRRLLPVGALALAMGCALAGPAQAIGMYTFDGTSTGGGKIDFSFTLDSAVDALSTTVVDFNSGIGFGFIPQPGETCTNSGSADGSCSTVIFLPDNLAIGGQQLDYMQVLSPDASGKWNIFDSFYFDAGTFATNGTFSEVTLTTNADLSQSVAPGSGSMNVYLPEPASAALVIPALFGLGFALRRRRDASHAA
jgi:hypothetical protein